MAKQQTTRRQKDIARLLREQKNMGIREAILEHLDDLEDTYLAEKGIEDISFGRNKSIPLKKVMERYGLED